MALEIAVTKKSVSLVMPKQWTIVLNMTCSESAVEVINRDFHNDYKDGDTISSLAGKFKADMQFAIDIYKAEQAIYSHIQMGQMVDYLNANLVG